MLLPWLTMNRRHSATAHFAIGVDQKRRRLAEEELRETTERALEAYVSPLENVTAFKYMEQVMTAGDDDWPEVMGNLQRERKSWGRLSRILIQEGADPKVSGKCLRK